MRPATKTSVLLVVAASGLVAATGFARELVVAWLFGTSAAADAFSLVLVYIEGLYVVISVGVAGYMLVPLIVRLDLEGGRSPAERLTETLQLWTSLGFVPVAAVAWLAPDATARAIAPGFGAEQHAFLVELLPSAALCALLLVAGAIFSGVLQARESYLGPVLGRGAFNAGIITMLLLGAAGDPRSAARGLIVGGVLQLVLQFAALWRSGWRPAVPHLGHLHLSTALSNGLPVVMGLFLMNVLAGAVQRSIGSSLEEGSLAAVNYAQRTLSLVSLFSLSIGTVSLTRLSAAASEDPTGGLVRAAMARHLAAMLWVVVPLSIWLALAATPLVVVLFQRGAYTPQSAELTAECLRWFAASLVPGGWLIILHRAAHAWNRNWLVTLSSGVLALATVGFTLVLLPRGATALPIALMVGNLAGLATVAWLMRRQFGPELLWDGFRATVICASRAAVAVLPLMIGSSWFLAAHVPPLSIGLRIGAGLALAGLIYVGIGLLTRDSMTREVVRWPGQIASPGV